MKALFELFRRFDARRIFGFIRRLGGMSRPKVKCYDLRSTHALRVEGDRHKIGRDMIQDLFQSTPSGWRATCRSTGTAVRTCHFYPRPPGGGRPRGNFHGLYIEIFLSTPSGWRATAGITRFIDAGTDFYPRPPGGGRRERSTQSHAVRTISIHALRVEGDSLMERRKATEPQFLSTPSGWRATAR